GARDAEDMQRLVADFNRDWPDVTGTREVLPLAEEYMATKASQHVVPLLSRDPYAAADVVRQTGRRLRVTHRRRWLWVPAFAHRSPGRRKNRTRFPHAATKGIGGKGNGLHENLAFGCGGVGRRRSCVRG